MSARSDDAIDHFGDSDFRRRLRDLPPSAKLVAKVLDDEGPLSQREVADRSLLPDRTVRYALGRLDEAGLTTSRYSYADARKQVYELSR